MFVLVGYHIHIQLEEVREEGRYIAAEDCNIVWLRSSHSLCCSTLGAVFSNSLSVENSNISDTIFPKFIFRTGISHSVAGMNSPLSSGNVCRIFVNNFQNCLNCQVTFDEI